MKLYDVTCLDYYESFNVKDCSFELIQKYEGIERMQEEWGIKELEKTDEGKKADIAYNWDLLSLILSQKAYDMLKDVFMEEVEMLPAVFEGQTYYIPHGIKAEKNIEIVYQDKKNKPYYLIFREEELNKIGADKKFFFRVAMNHGVVTEMLFTQRFVDIVKEYGLKGIGFDEIGETQQEEK